MTNNFSFSEKFFSILCDKKRKEWSDNKKKMSFEERRLIQEKEWKKFWERIGEEEPCFKNKVIVDYGCGYGYDSLFMLENGATHIYCLEIDANRLKDSEKLHKLNGFTNTAYINNMDVRALAGKIGKNNVNVIVCRNVMEHVPSPLDVLDSMFTVLKPKGIAYIGFSPIYKSPYGSHFGGKCKVPWAHLFFSEKTILNVFKKLYGLPASIQRYQKIPGSGVNKMHYYNYVEMLYTFKWDIVNLYINHFTRRPILMKSTNLLVKLIPFKKFKELMIINSYTKLIKNNKNIL